MLGGGLLKGAMIWFTARTYPMSLCWLSVCCGDAVELVVVLLPQPASPTRHTTRTPIGFTSANSIRHGGASAPPPLYS